MTPDNKKIIDLESARKKQKAEKQKQGIKNIFNTRQKKSDEGNKKYNDPNKPDIWKWLQFFAALGVTALLMQQCGFF